MSSANFRYIYTYMTKYNENIIRHFCLKCEVKLRMVNDKSLVIAVIGIVILAGAVTVVLHGVNQEPVVGDAMFNWRPSMGDCAVFNPNNYNSDQLERYCDRYCLGWTGDNDDGLVITRNHQSQCCCSSGVPVG